MRTTLILCSFLFICLCKLSAQNKAVKITGTIKDAAGKSLVAVSVSLLKAKDSSLVKMAITGKDGHYEFENIADGEYLFSSSLVGYEKITGSSFTHNASAGSIAIPVLQMIAAAKGLSEVVVTFFPGRISARSLLRSRIGLVKPISKTHLPVAVTVLRRTSRTG